MVMDMVVILVVDSSPGKPGNQPLVSFVQWNLESACTSGLPSQGLF